MSLWQSMWRAAAISLFTAGCAGGTGSADPDSTDIVVDSTSSSDADSDSDSDSDSDGDSDADTDSDTDADSDSDSDSDLLPLRIEAECAWGPDVGDCGGAVQGGTNANLPGQDGAASIPLLKEGDQVVGYFFAGSWLAFPGIDLTGYTQVAANVASAATGGSFEVRLDASDGELIATIDVPNTGSWETFASATADLPAVTGVHTVYLVSADNGTYNGDVDWIEFTAESQVEDTGVDTSVDTSVDTESDSGTSTDPKFRVFLLIGQSNMAGGATPDAGDRVEDARIRVLGYDNCASTARQYNEWDIAAPPLHACWSDGVGPGDWFAKTLIDALPEGDTIGLVPCAIPGVDIDFFRKGVTSARRAEFTIPPDNHWVSAYDWVLERARIAQADGGVISGIIFHQGEADWTAELRAVWISKVSEMVSDLRVDLRAEDMPFVAGELLYGGCCQAHNDLVNQIPDTIPNSYAVSAEGLAGVDAYHFDAPGVRILGQRYADAMTSAMGLK